MPLNYQSKLLRKVQKRQKKTTLISLFFRLRNLQAWAESQGLELAAECHLAKIVQCAHLLQAPKYTAEELANLSAACFKLNSLQLRALLTQYKGLQ